MIQDSITQVWVKIFGRKITPEKDSWLTGPIGHEDIIGDRFIELLKEKENAEVTRNETGSGILNNIENFHLSADDKQKLHPQIKDFYLHTTDYHFEIRSKWMGIFKPFGWLLTLFFSKRLQQLNLPTNSSAIEKGVNSEIIQIKKEGKTIWTIWLRKLRKTNDVVFSGIYTTIKNPLLQHHSIKVIFPLPNGNASVFMSIQVKDDRSLLLSSDGKRFGENGFYFYLQDRKGRHWAKFVKVLHEWLHVYVDEQETLRADHSFRFYGINFLNLHYKMTLKS